MNESTKKFIPKHGMIEHLPQNIIKLFKQKKNLRRRMYRIQDRNEYITRTSILQRLNKIIQEKIRLFEENYYEPKLNSITTNGDMYRKVKKFCSTQRTKISQLKNKQNQAIHKNEEKANLISE